MNFLKTTGVCIFLILSPCFLGIISCKRFNNATQRTIVFPNFESKYFITNKNPDTWKNLNFDDSNWNISTIGIAEGYDTIDYDTKNDTLYIRVPFYLKNKKNIQSVLIESRLQANYTIFLNGIKIKEIINLPLDEKIKMIEKSEEREKRYKKLFTQSVQIRKNDITGYFKKDRNILCIAVFKKEMVLKNFSPLVRLSVECKTNKKENDDNIKRYSTHLPIIKIDTKGNDIVDEPKIDAEMEIINNHSKINKPSDEKYEAKVSIGIEIRGNTSQAYSKKSYSIEIRDSAGNDLDFPILGLPKDDDWVLYAPYADKTFMRNVLSYDLFRKMGHYSVKTRYCELIINNEYKGLYVLTEKIKANNSRVNISKINKTDTSGNSLSGGYIVAIDNNPEATVWPTTLPSLGNKIYTYYSILYPKEKQIQPVQFKYISDYIIAFESTFKENINTGNNPEYLKYINTESFIDYFIINEFTKNIDSYRLSTFMYKDRDNISSKLNIGPIWDFNFSLGLPEYHDGYNYKGWVFEENMVLIPPWWPVLIDDSYFRNHLKQRWTYLRQNILSEESLMNNVDSLSNIVNEAVPRNFNKWKISNKYTWPVYFNGKNFEDDKEYMKFWITERLKWMDANL